MNVNPASRERRLRIAVLVVAAATVAWRAGVLPFDQLWRDWIVILAFYGAYSTLKRDARSWPLATAAVTAFLLGIYVQGQLRHVLTVLGLSS
jgi:hypothetical protein